MLALLQYAGARRGRCARTGCAAGRSGGSSEPSTASTPGRSRQTSSTKSSLQRHPTRNGARTSRTSGPASDGSYLAVVIDLFSRRVVGWAVDDRQHVIWHWWRCTKSSCDVRPRAHSSFGPRQPILLRGLTSRGALPRHPYLHVSQKKLLMTTPWSRRSPRPSNPNSSGGRSSTPAPRRNSHCPLYRRILQSRQAPFRARPYQPRAVRTSRATLNTCLSTLPGKVQLPYQHPAVPQ